MKLGRPTMLPEPRDTHWSWPPRLRRRSKSTRPRSPANLEQRKGGRPRFGDIRQNSMQTSPARIRVGDFELWANNFGAFWRGRPRTTISVIRQAASFDMRITRTNKQTSTYHNVASCQVVSGTFAMHRLVFIAVLTAS